MTGNVQIDHMKYFNFFTLTTAGGQFESLQGVLWSGFLTRDVLNSLLIFIKELLILWEEAAQTTFNVLIRLHTRRMICAFVVHMWYKDSFSHDNILIYMIKYYGYMFICSSFYVSTASLK